MSLGVVVKGPEGIVLAADSRVTLATRGEQPVLVNYDNATKLLTFGNHPKIAAVTYGTAVIGLRTAHSFLPEFDLELKEKKPLKVKECAKKLSDFFMKQWADRPELKSWAGPSMTFIVAGFDHDAAYGSVFIFEVPYAPEPQERNADENFGMTWGGQHEIASRILQGYDPALPAAMAKALQKDEEEVTRLLTEQVRPDLEFRIPYMALPLQDCVDLATFLVRTTIAAQEFAEGVRGVGGPIDVAYITRTEGIKWLQRKVIRGESGFLDALGHARLAEE